MQNCKKAHRNNVAIFWSKLMIMAIREAAVPQWQRNKQTNTKRKWWHDLYHPTSFEESHVIWLSVFVFGVCASVRERFTHCLIIISFFTLLYCHCYCSTAAAAEKVSRPTLHCGSQARYNSQCRKSYIYWIFMEMKFKRIITIKHFSFCSLFFPTFNSHFAIEHINFLFV